MLKLAKLLLNFSTVEYMYVAVNTRHVGSNTTICQNVEHEFLASKKNLSSWWVSYMYTALSNMYIIACLASLWNIHTKHLDVSTSLFDQD